MAEAPTSVSKPAPKKYTFGAPKSSGLSAIADKMWDKSKQEFGEQLKKPIVLEHKNLSDVLGKLKQDADRAKDGTNSGGENKSTFVFGQKLSERVFKPTHETTSSDTTTKAEDLLKGAAAEKSKTSLLNDSTTNGDVISTKDRLKADAEQVSKEEQREHERNLASTSVIEVKTGEENDRNIYSFSCKIHAFDRTKQQWVEKGLSQLRINRLGEEVDGWEEAPSEEHYRIVARTFGTMKVVINSPVFSSMLVEKTDERRIKITAVGPDDAQPQIFLLTANLSKTESVGEQIYSSLCEVRDKVKATERSRKRPASEEIGEEKGPEKKKQMEEVTEKTEGIHMNEEKKEEEEEKDEEDKEKKEEEEDNKVKEDEEEKEVNEEVTESN